jgi:arylamine N-acetyltransferase
MPQTQLALNRAGRPHFTADEIQDYLKVIKLPQQYLDSLVRQNLPLASTTDHGLPFLQALTRYHTCNIPFENLELHYSAHRKITLDPSQLYDKFVRRRRGGRCMENNTFFATVLRSLGYQVRNCGGRVSRAMSPYADVRRDQSATYDGWNHMLNLVRIAEEWYVVDVGMGAMEPNMPYPLRDGFETISIAPRKIRLQLRAIAETYASEAALAPKMWCYDVCYGPVSNDESVWTPTYCFTETEFLPQDYEVMSWFTSTHESSFFTKSVMCTKMIMDEEKGFIVGNRTLFGDSVQETIGAEKMMLKECKTEVERVQALEELFDVVLTGEERDAVLSEVRLGSSAQSA